jgi:hypothetical protein
MKVTIGVWSCQEQRTVWRNGAYRTVWVNVC